MEQNQFDTELIAKVLDGIASEQEKQELLTWINQSKENETFYFTIKDIYDAGNWEQLTREAQTAQSWKLIRSRISDKTDSGKVLSKKYLIIAKYAAVFIVGIAFTLFLSQIITTSSTQFKNTIATGKGERTQIVLPDSTRVWINSCSSLEYTYDYGTKSRNVYLKGEAFFKVAKNKKLPFIVHTADCSIKALGTSFNVMAYENDNELSAVLLEGSISFEKINSNKKAIIKPGEKISYFKSTNQFRREQVSPELYTSWRSGETRFEQLTMEEITKRLQRIYNVTIIPENEKIRLMYFTGSFRSYESIDQIIKVITTNTGLTYSFKNDTVYLK